MENHLHDLLTDGGLALGAQLRFGSAPIAELFAAAGFDFVVIDAEHAPQTPVGIQAQLQAVNGYPCTPIVRFGRNDPDEISSHSTWARGASSSLCCRRRPRSRRS